MGLCIGRAPRAAESTELGMTGISFSKGAGVATEHGGRKAGAGTEDTYRRDDLSGGVEYRDRQGWPP